MDHPAAERKNKGAKLKKANEAKRQKHFKSDTKPEQMKKTAWQEKSN